MPDHPMFARFYDRLTARTERAGLAEMRRSLLSAAAGRVLELGAGTGHNLQYYTDAVTELVLAEPDPNMARILRERLEREGTAAGNPSVIEAPAEELPFDDGSFDVVVATLVLCTVEDPGRALAEVRRVLVEGGRFLYLEHVRSARRGLARWQDWLERPWGWVSGGCHPNRATDQLLAGAGFWIDSLERDKLPKAPPLVRPVIRGVAVRPGGVGGA
ncbi:MAG TPA: class I SAM-dependent methyltransferase [Solirubrobacterales bacterium]|nr:class I SAM-dependent methyltransferase [Solirubrobacterales bacterium]